jgi:hypothetical protein
MKFVRTTELYIHTGLKFLHTTELYIAADSGLFTKGDC